MSNSKEEKILKAFGRKIQKLRKDKKLSYRRFAIEADLAPSHVQKLEAGESNPTLTTLLKIAEALGIELNEFTS